MRLHASLRQWMKMNSEHRSIKLWNVSAREWENEARNQRNGARVSTDFEAMIENITPNRTIMADVDDCGTLTIEVRSFCGKSVSRAHRLRGGLLAQQIPGHQPELAAGLGRSRSVLC